MNKFLAGVIQLDSQDDVQANLAAADQKSVMDREI